MRILLSALLALFATSAPAKAAPDIYEAVLIKQFLVCEGPMADGCARFGEAAFAAALEIFQRAARNGDAGAQNNLAMLYETGAGVAVDRTVAVRWFTKSAEAGVAMARYNLAMLLATDHIMQQSDRPQHREADLTAAYMWLSLAAETGLALAIDAKPELAGFLTPKLIEAAERLQRAR